MQLSWGSEDDGCPALTRANYMPAIQFPISLAVSFLVCKMGILFTQLFISIGSRRMNSGFPGYAK